jgi:hypothetical protein
MSAFAIDDRKSASTNPNTIIGVRMVHLYHTRSASWTGIARADPFGKRGAAASFCAANPMRAAGDQKDLAVILRRPPQAITEIMRGTKQITPDIVQRARVKRVEVLARIQNVGRFDRSRLRAVVPNTVAGAESVDSVAEVPPLLKRLGGKFVVVPHLPKTRLDGAAAFTVDGPDVALTMRLDRIDYSWFTLLHELAHLVLEHRGGHLDGETDGEAIGPEQTGANRLASSWLVSDQAIRAFAVRHRGKPSKAAIEAFAQDHRLHPGIVVGRLHHLKIAPFTHFRPMLVKVRGLPEPWTDAA